MHKAVHTTLSRWLKSEAQDKKGVEIDEKKIQYTHAQVSYLHQLVVESIHLLTQRQVPLQTNFSDCGLYLVHYATQLLSQPEKVLRFIEVSLE